MDGRTDKQTVARCAKSQAHCRERRLNKCIGYDTAYERGRSLKPKLHQEKKKIVYVLCNPGISSIA